MTNYIPSIYVDELHVHVRKAIVGLAILYVVSPGAFENVWNLNSQYYWFTTII